MQAEADLMKGRFSQASDKIMSKFKDLSSTIDDMEKNLNQLVKQEEVKAAAAAAAAAATQGVSSDSRSRLSPPKSLGRSMTASFRSRNTGTSS
jgi:outer membrane murein-binding lipoprotein Lpp